MFVKPYFYDSFLCKADKCTDTCCAGWEIDIDDKTMALYSDCNCSFSECLKQGIYINSDGQHSFCLKDGEKCYFLCDNGLCEIYSRLGKDALCDICSEHPRFYNDYTDSTEAGLGLCCEKVCELLFENNSRFELICEGETDDSDYSEMFSIRKKVFDIISNNNDFNEIAVQLIDYVLDENSFYSDAKYYKRKIIDNLTFYNAVADLFSETEPINHCWTDFLVKIKNRLNEIRSVPSETVFELNDYKKFLAYVIYRHFIESAYEDGMLRGLAFSLVSAVFVYICDCCSFLERGSFDKSDRINNVKLWSKQIEYSAYNTQLVQNGAFDLLFE